jgi:hypothetical protein
MGVVHFTMAPTFRHTRPPPSARALMSTRGSRAARQAPPRIRSVGFPGRCAPPVTKGLIAIPHEIVLRRFAESHRLPIIDFDLAFFVEGLFLSCSCHDRIAA